MNYIIAPHELIEQTLGAEKPTLLHEFFERQVGLRPDKIAVECNGEVLTYAQLDQLANGIATHLNGRFPENSRRKGEITARMNERDFPHIVEA